jgi:hypothetical protein
MNNRIGDVILFLGIGFYVLMFGIGLPVLYYDSTQGMKWEAKFLAWDAKRIDSQKEDVTDYKSKKIPKSVWVVLGVVIFIFIAYLILIVIHNSVYRRWR